MRHRGNRYTVVFYVDHDHGVETFVEHVTCAYGDAFEKAVAKVRRNGAHECRRDELNNATEISTFPGHLEQARA